MSKRKIKKETMINAIQAFCSGLKSRTEITEELGIGRTTFTKWVSVYEKYGADYLEPKKGNASYPKEFKLMIVLEYLSGKGSYDSLCIKYNISHQSVVQRWVREYNEGKEFKDYDPKQGIYLMKSRKVSKEEKIDIVEFCLNNFYNYKLSAEKFAVPYGQVYQWVQKYKKDGVAGLADGRGRRKPAPLLSEVEQLKKELEITKRKLEYSQIENEILKKKEEIELRQIFQKPGKR